MKKPKILIVGAGAGGMVTGYLFNLSGADVTFYVRPGRLEEMTEKPKKLYCYDDNQVKLFDQYNTICSMDDIAGEQFDYVLTTLDGKAMHSDEGKQLLTNLGNAVRESNPVLVCLGVAQGIVDFIAEHTGLPKERSLFGSFALLSHNIPLPVQAFPEAVDQQALADCVFAYRHILGNTGLSLSRVNGKLAKSFAQTFGQSGVSSCSVAPNLRVMDFFSDSFPFPGFIGCVIEGWPEHREMYKTETWQLVSDATKEIIALPQYGLPGKLMALAWSLFNLQTIAWKWLDNASSPLDFRSFNRFHHGGKVLAQDIEICHDILAREEKAGRHMPKLRALLERHEKIDNNQR